MKKRSLIPFILLAIGLLSCGQNQKEVLRADLIRILRELPGHQSVAFISLSGNDSLMIHPDLTYHAASTMKTPVMLEAFRQAAAGEYTLDDSIQIRNAFRSIVDSSTYRLNKVDDSDTLIYNRVGRMATRRELIDRMITVSSNLATNILIEEVGASRVEATLRSLGLNALRVLRGVEDQAAFEAGLNNVTNAREQALLYEGIARFTAADTASCREMIRILSNQKFNDAIPAGVPQGTQVAHKTGWIRGVHHDGGIVMLADGRSYVLVILTSGWTDDALATKTMVQISKRVYDYVNETVPLK